MLSKIIPTSGYLQGHFIPPGDKSISHRALMFGALADGKSHYENFLEAEDCLRTLKAFQSMGVEIHLEKGRGKVDIQGVGLKGLKQPQSEIDLGNSGTSMRLLLGILAGQNVEATLSGDASLSTRPMKRVTQPLKQMGAQIKGKDNGNFAPLTIRGGKLKAIEFENRLSSAQVKSALLFAGLFAEGKTKISEPVLSRDHTEKFLEACGAPLEKTEEGKVLTIQKTSSLKPLSGEIPGDPSSAAFFIVGAAITPNSEVCIKKMCLNPTRIGFLDVLKRMGAKTDIQITHSVPDLIGNVTVHGSRLQGVRIEPDEVPRLIDELPILMIALATAEGESLVSGAAELRVKETDRLTSMVTNLKAVGGHAEELPDGCLIRGVESFQGGKIRSFTDHRTAMSFAIASLRSSNPIEIDDVSCVATSFPQFFSVLEKMRQNP